MEFNLERGPDGSTVVHLTFAPGDGETTVADALALAENAGPDATIWVHGTTTERRSILEASGRTSNRTLLKMWCSIPVLDASGSPVLAGIETVAFTKIDVDDFVSVNNDAFSWHPEQSGLTAEAVRGDMNEPWFDAEGFRLLRLDGQLAGFCWTKVHPTDELAEAHAASGTEPGDTRAGEIYVIAVHPSFHGRGLGKALTLAGLEHLSSLGIGVAILYVESDNEAAVATYEKLGFVVGREDTLWASS